MKTRFLHIFMLTAIIMGLVFTARAESAMSAGSLKSLCENERGKLICIGYISGVTDALVLMSDMKKSGSGESIICIPGSGISNDKSLRIVLNYIIANPVSVTQSARVIIITALTKAFPC